MSIQKVLSNQVDSCRHHTIEQIRQSYAAASVLSEDNMQQAWQEIRQWSQYEPTPLHRLNKLSERLGCAEIHYKDESGRFGLGSFKALGGAYAVLKVIASEYQKQHKKTIQLSDIRRGEHGAFANSITVATATDGNHGRSVAWGAKNAGCPCRIYIHKEVSEGRQQAMEALGAEVIRVDGDYDESVRVCASDCQKHGWQMVSDTSYDGYMEVPRDVMAGYTVLAAEITEQLSDPPTHVFLQAGVGGLAASVAARLWLEYGSERPYITVVESDYSACVLKSFVDAKPATVDITQETVMAGLSCGEMSLLAWQILKGCCDQVMTLNDDNVAAAMKLFADAEMADFAIEAGECAVPGVLALIAHSRLQADNALQDARVLVLGCEGATDPEIYQAMLASV